MEEATRRLVGSAEEVQEGGLGLQWLTAEVLEGYFCGLDLPLKSVGSKPQTGIPGLEHQNQERNPNNFCL